MSMHLGLSFMKCRFMEHLGWVSAAEPCQSKNQEMKEEESRDPAKFLDLFLGQNFEQVKNTSFLFDRVLKGFPDGSICKEPACPCRRLGFDP